MAPLNITLLKESTIMEDKIFKTRIVHKHDTESN